MKKKILVGIAMLILCMSFSISAFALTEGDWEFQLLDDEVTITGYHGEGGDVVIPSEIYGRPVTKVEGGGMFVDKATSLTFPSTIKIIDCGGYVWGGENTLKTVIFSEGVEEIRDWAFHNCNALETVTFPSTLKKIGEVAFEGCGSLKSIKFPSQSLLEEIGGGAFRNCVNAREVFLPERLKSIGKGAFANTGVEEIYVPPIEKMGSYVFGNCKALKKAVIGIGITELPDSIFEDCTSLEIVELPNTLENLADYNGGVFEGCKSLKKIVLPTSLKFLGPFTFYGCSALKEVVVPFGVEEIGSEAFARCENLEAVYVPDTVKEIGDNYTIIKDSPNCIIYCSKGSYTETVCKKKSISYLTDNSVNSLITVYYNGTRISFHEQGQNPELINSRTLVPLRAIFEAMDAEVEWNQETKTVTATRDGVEISISIGANVMYKDGEEIAVDVPAQLINDRTMVPVRVIAEAFGADVEWNNNGRAVLIEE